MRRSCGRSTSEIRWLRNERLARIEPARRRNRLIPFHAGYNRGNPSFFQITNRFDRTHARPERNSGATVRILMVVIEAITRWPSRCPPRVCAVQRRRFPVGASPTRQSLQPEAIGAVMEATKWLKPSISVSRIGDSASVQAATRVNAEQSSKRTMRRSTRQPYRGRLIRLEENERSDTFRRCAGVVAAACTQGKRTKHGKPQGVVRDDQPEAREGQAGRPGVAERFVVPRKPGNAGGGKGPQFKTDAIRGEGPGDWETYQLQ